MTRGWAAAPCAIAVAVVATCPPAAADEGAIAPTDRQPAPSGVRVALRSGLAFPRGQAFEASGPLADTIVASVPVRLDLGYRIRHHLYLGVDAQLAPILPRACPTGSRCSGSDLRFGFIVAYHLLPRRLVDPWLGAGLGYESMNASRSIDGARVDVSARGFEILDLDLGVDIRPAPALRVGPVLSTSIARFTEVAVNGTATHDFDRSTHAWLMVGLRGAYDS